MQSWPKSSSDHHSANLSRSVVLTQHHARASQRSRFSKQFCAPRPPRALRCFACDDCVHCIHCLDARRTDAGGSMRSHLPHSHPHGSSRQGSRRRSGSSFTGSRKVAPQHGTDPTHHTSYADDARHGAVAFQRPDFRHHDSEYEKAGSISNGPGLPPSTPDRAIVISHNDVLSPELPYYLQGLISHQVRGACRRSAAANALVHNFVRTCARTLLAMWST